jgi:hypothetical protein
VELHLVDSSVAGEKGFVLSDSTSQAHLHDLY